ncbi:ABC transporter substrate-binding protein [Thiorhodococcus minor]|uniref:Solute-binding protein n=1 Tax=Thiorhodococcus minor TaxID=57489 RepID=A0A6M0JVT3_9GAMM|nr:extracellular solute-binding protein [Thiorhodococcus minor]NEV61164.1 solute-binding protein [Thiorhodococcus minor]
MGWDFERLDEVFAMLGQTGRHLLLHGLLGLLLSLFLAACDSGDVAVEEVTIYTSVDQHFSEPLFRRFEQVSGVRVRPVYDIEAAKTTGLVNRLIGESKRPLADVLWNGEVSQMRRLAEHGVLAIYRPKRLPEGVALGPKGRWLEFGGRVRVFIINRQRLGSRPPPTSIVDLLDPRWQGGDIAIAYPLFGTTATHAVALAEVWGVAPTLDFFSQLERRGIRFVDGNSVVRDLVVSARAVFGLTDTDDACGAVARGEPVFATFPDQGAEGMGALVIPNSVGLIEGAPHEEAAKRFIDFVIGEEATALLAQSGWLYVSGRQVVADPDCRLPARLKRMSLPSGLDAEALDRLRRDLRDVIVR